jgi:hypothetical protein
MYSFDHRYTTASLISSIHQEALPKHYQHFTSIYFSHLKQGQTQCSGLYACREVVTRRRSHGGRLHHAEIRHGLGVAIPVGQGTESATLVSAEEREAVDVTCVDPSEAVKS